MANKIFGWVLLVFGAGLIIWTLFSSYNIFTLRAEAPAFFEVPQQQKSVAGNTQDLEAQLQKVIAEQLKGFLPANSITQLLNLIVWSILAFILISGSSQLAGIGIKLIQK